MLHIKKFYINFCISIKVKVVGATAASNQVSSLKRREKKKKRKEILKSLTAEIRHDEEENKRSINN